MITKAASGYKPADILKPSQTPNSNNDQYPTKTVDKTKLDQVDTFYPGVDNKYPGKGKNARKGNSIKAG